MAGFSCLSELYIDRPHKSRFPVEWIRNVAFFCIRTCCLPSMSLYLWEAFRCCIVWARRIGYWKILLEIKLLRDHMLCVYRSPSMSVWYLTVSEGHVTGDDRGRFQWGLLRFSWLGRSEHWVGESAESFDVRPCSLWQLHTHTHTHGFSLPARLLPSHPKSLPDPFPQLNTFYVSQLLTSPLRANTKKAPR